MIKKIITLSLITSSFIFANETELSSLNIESTVLTEVAQNAQLSADLGDALSSSVPSVDLVRRSGIANDVLIRGQKRDNISVSVDGTKVQGACPNRMDPPISHIITSQIQDIEVIEGPYDVEEFGTMSGGIKIKTKQPSKELQAEINLAYGAWNYMKVGLGVSGGNDFIRMLISASTESSNQYKDGNGNTLAQQIQNNADANPADSTAQGAVLKPKYTDMKAYTKSSVMAKMFINLTQDQELRLGYTANRSDDVLYANSTMDAIYDDSNIYNAEYIIKNISDIYKDIHLQYYYSDVVHPMGTDYRISSDPSFGTNGGTAKVIRNHLNTTMQGAKIKSNFNLSSYKVLVGLDANKRTWDGEYFKNGAPLMGGKKKYR